MHSVRKIFEPKITYRDRGVPKSDGELINQNLSPMTSGYGYAPKIIAVFIAFQYDYGNTQVCDIGFDSIEGGFEDEHCKTR